MAQIVFCQPCQRPYPKYGLMASVSSVGYASRNPSFFLVTRQAHYVQHPATDDLYSTKSPYNIQSLVIYSRQTGGRIVLCATTYYAP